MHDDDHDRGLAFDLRRLLGGFDRRQMLRLLAGATLVPFLPACGDGADAAGGADAGGGGDAPAGTCATIPSETAGPYPGDGTNGKNALTLSGIVRGDIRASIVTSTTVAAGIPLTVKLRVVSSKSSCAALSGYAVYLWHCDREGQYSMYTTTNLNDNYLRGVQQTDSNGDVTFTTIFPGCYSGRWPHMHFEVYPSLAAATNGSSKVGVSQLALPEAACDAVYGTTGYGQSATNLSKITLASDNVFSDGSELQVAAVTGSTTAGYMATLQTAFNI